MLVTPEDALTYSQAVRNFGETRVDMVKNCHNDFQLLQDLYRIRAFFDEVPGMADFFTAYLQIIKDRIVERAALVTLMGAKMTTLLNKIV